MLSTAIVSEIEEVQTSSSSLTIHDGLFLGKAGVRIHDI